jgi:hypothetical protein
VFALGAWQRDGLPLCGKACLLGKGAGQLLEALVYRSVVGLLPSRQCRSRGR